MKGEEMEEWNDKLESSHYFDIAKVAQRYHLDFDTARRLLAEARQEFENDDMMAELHTIRAIRRLSTAKMRKAS